jgi:hypothetical protein
MLSALIVSFLPVLFSHSRLRYGAFRLWLTRWKQQWREVGGHGGSMIFDVVISYSTKEAAIANAGGAVLEAVPIAKNRQLAHG